MSNALPLKQLSAFESAARHLSFTKAATDLNVLQPAISRQIAQLEEDFGASLFTRTKPALTLTREGEMLFTAVTSGFNTMRKAVEELRSTTRITPLVVNVSMGFMSYFLMTRLAGFRAAFPEIEIELVTCDQYTGYNPEQSDIVIIFGKSGLPGMHAVPVMKEEMIAVCSPEYFNRNKPRSLHDLKTMKLLSLADSTHINDWQTFLEGTGVDAPAPPRHEHFVSYMVYKQAALAGEGIALEVAGLSEELIESGRLMLACERRIATDRAYFCCLNDRARDNQAAREFVSWLTDQNSPP